MTLKNSRKKNLYLAMLFGCSESEYNCSCFAASIETSGCVEDYEGYLGVSYCFS
jgi:hypothetical protein